MAEAGKPLPMQGGAADVAQASQLCTNCGLCCTGVVHDAGVLDEDEVAPAAELGLKLLPPSVRAGWSFPCPALNGKLCGIFGRRPRCCSRYKCQVLVELLDGKLSYDEAAARTQEALQLFADFLAVRPDYLSIHDSKVMAKNRLFTPSLKEVVDKATALQLYVDRFFRKPNEEKLLPEPGPGSEGATQRTTD